MLPKLAIPLLFNFSGVNMVVGYLKSNRLQQPSFPGVGAADLERIRVICRFRPQNARELESGGQSVASVSKDGKTVKLLRTRGASGRFTGRVSPVSDSDDSSGASAMNARTFRFDHAFPPDSTQSEIYHRIGVPVVQSVLEGYNGTVFAYGQTSSGKTHTMEGPDITDKDARGIIPRLFADLFVGVEKADENVEFTIRVGMIEIYLERIRDLLEPANIDLKVREDVDRGIWVDGASEHYIISAQEILDLMSQGAGNRKTASTNMNDYSSRSHLSLWLR